MANRIRTSKGVAKKASSQLRSKKTTPATKSVAGSALSNRRKQYIVSVFYRDFLDTNLDTQFNLLEKYTIIKQNNATKWQDFAFLLQKITISCAP